jgi:hypothetical protein
MKFKIGYTVNGEEDSVIIEGDTIEECQEKAQAEVKKRGATNAWSEEIN